MLILRRNLGEAIVLNQDIVIRIIAIQGDRIKLGIEAPNDVIVRREELCYQRPQTIWVRHPDIHLTDVATPPTRSHRVVESAYISRLQPWQEPVHRDVDNPLAE